MELYQTLQNVKHKIGLSKRDIKSVINIASGNSLSPYIGFVGYSNLGDELIFEAYKQLFPQAKFIVFGKGAWLLEKNISFFKSDLPYAALGGGTLINEGELWLQLTEKLLDRGVPVFCFGTGVSELITQKSTLDRWIKALNEFKFVGVRGPLSNKVLCDAGFKHATVLGDTALSLAPSLLIKKRQNGIIGINYGHTSSDLPSHISQNYRLELVKLIRKLIVDGQKIVLLPVWSNDLPTNQSLVEEIDNPNCQLKCSYKSYREYSDAIQKCDIFIGQKLHSTIVALMNGVPSIMIDYHSKCADFMESVELREYDIKISDFSMKLIIQKIQELRDKYTFVTSHIESKILEYKKLQSKTAEKLNIMLRS